MPNPASILKRVDGPVLLPDPMASPGQLMSMQDPALPLMTDLRNGPTIAVEPTMQIDQALELMRSAAVRLCIVIDDSRHLLGAISAHDIQGDRPIRVMQAAGSDRRSASRRDLTVGEVMHPLSQMQVIGWRDAERASIGMIVEAMKLVGQRHLLVVETDKGLRRTLRGLFAASRIERATGTALEIHPKPASFADYERAVEHPELI